MSRFFAWPEALPLLALAPTLLVLLHLLDGAKRRRRRVMFGARSATLSAELSAPERKARRLLAAAGVLFALLAAVQPILGETSVDVAQRGVDIAVCLDVSRSMLARDVAPSRLLGARRAIRDLAEHARGDRLALVAFAGDARLQVPLTQDMDSFCEILDLTGTESVDRGGTDLGRAIETALSAFGTKTGGHETILLVTDGEDHGEKGLAAAGTCRDRGVVVHAVGFGSTAGSKIVVDDQGKGAFLRDGTGRDVVTALDSKSLAQLAEAAGGTYVDAASAPSPLVALYERKILPMARKAFTSDRVLERGNRFQWPLLLALVLLAIELSLTERKLR